MKKITTKITMDSGDIIDSLYEPKEIMELFVGSDGKIRDEFIEFGIYYINPKHVSLLEYVEK